MAQLITPRRSADGYELTFATNHLGHFLLANLRAEYLTPSGRDPHIGSLRALRRGCRPTGPPRWCGDDQRGALVRHGWCRHGMPRVRQEAGPRP
jgi:NAD(P)-dependent dehydrogenase (short-subunit alcohol dehydrogenase family)